MLNESGIQPIIAEEQVAQHKAATAMDVENLVQNHSTANGSVGEIVLPPSAEPADLFKSLKEDQKHVNFLTGESSDSEGPLPEIDCGISSSEDSGEEHQQVDKEM